MEISLNEEKVLLELVYDRLIELTPREVRGDLTEVGKSAISTLRGLLRRVIKDLGETPSEVEALLLGLTEFVSESTLERYMKEERDRHLTPLANYFFLQKVKEK